MPARALLVLTLGLAVDDEGGFDVRRFKRR